MVNSITLHTGHIYLIQRACSQVDGLHVILCHDEPRDKELFINSAMSQQPTVEVIGCAGYYKLLSIRKIFVFMSLMNMVSSLNRMVGKCGVRVSKLFYKEKQIAPDFIHTSEREDASQYEAF